MAATIYSLESVNLICGDVGNENQPGYSTHLTLRTMKLPGIEENYVDHVPGGVPMAMEVNTHINRLESTFTLAGWQPDIMKMMGRSLRELQHYTAYGLIRDQRSGRAVSARAVLWGRMGRVNPTDYSKGDLMGHEYSIRGITHYELYFQLGTTTPSEAGTMAMDEIYYWDFFEPAWRVGGIDIRAEENQVLGIYGAAI